MKIRSRLTAFIFFYTPAFFLMAGGSGLNVLVVVNTNSANSLQLGNYYCEKRNVPPQNVLRIGWSGSNIEWGLASHYEPILLNPLVAKLSERGLTNQIEYVVLSTDIPYRLSAGFKNNNSTTAVMYYGFKSDTNYINDACSMASNSASAYAGSEGVFRQTPPVNAASNSFLVTMITASNLAQAKLIVDSGVLADGLFPTQTVQLTKTTDTARNVRYALFDDAIFNTRVGNIETVIRTNSNNVANLTNCMGFQTGLASNWLAGTSFARGAMADSLTSFGGMLFEERYGQSSLLDFLLAGAAGSYGTVLEPCAYLSKFPTPQNYFYQSRGFSLGECYYMSVTNPYQGLIVGEPLSAPFAMPCSGLWSNLPSFALLTGTTNLSLQFIAADSQLPVQQVDLFVDGLFFQTLTNIPPGQSNLLYVTINGFPTNYTVPAGATIQTVTSNLTSRLNANAYRNATKVRPFAHGDRIELRSTNIAVKGTAVSISTSNSIGTAPALTTHIHASRNNFLDTIAFGIRSFQIGIGVATNESLTLTVTKTNGGNVTVSITNYTEGITLHTFLNQFMNAINATAALQSADGLVAEDLTVVRSTPPEYSEFNLRARSAGWDAAQIQVTISGPFDIDPPGLRRLDGNLSDLQPRNHLYITAGLTNLAFVFPLDTTLIPDGSHELTAVAYEGSHVRTQNRVSQSVLVQNTTLTATFNCLSCDTNSAFPVDGTLQFSIGPNTNAITRIELFSTGGSWGVTTNQPTALFSIDATNLQLGLHPFYALVTRDDGAQYRTETKWLRIYNPFALSIDATGPVISWPAITGQVYEVFSATTITDAFTLRETFTATSTNASWTETNNTPPHLYYRVRTQP